mgnify:CR=1 FL=1
MDFLPLRATGFEPERAAVMDDSGTYSYGQLSEGALRWAHLLLNGQSDLFETRVAFMVDPGADYVQVQWGIWLAGGVAVPLCITHPLPSLQYTLEDTGADILVVAPQYLDLLLPVVEDLNIRLLTLADQPAKIPDRPWPTLHPGRRAMILYTSGTTSKPKGVVTTHGQISAQISTLVDAWQWTAQDHIVCVLPLHHVHGIINVVGCALWSGARITFLPAFEADKVFGLFETQDINLFMAVPTVYFKMMAWLEEQPPEKQAALKERMAAFRLMVSGSAALPVSVMERWQSFSGQTLLERYGMTEIGMALSNPYIGERKPGHVGQPLPGVQVRLVDEKGAIVLQQEPGEIQVKGPSVFKEYWQRPEATQAAFTRDGWFRTGDVAVFENGSYRILGRLSTDIIKSGGYKLSALEIEECMRNYEHLSDCAVIALPDEEWGEIVAAALVVKTGFDLPVFKDWLRLQLPGYKVPRRYLFLDALPRNAMGKVTKPALRDLFESQP